MGQKVNPIGFRLGVIKGWDSNWFGGNDYGDKLLEDDKIRTYLKARLAKGSISKIVIERTLKLITVTINTATTSAIMIIIIITSREVVRLSVPDDLDI